MTPAPFQDHIDAHDYAEANGLDLVWEGTKAFEKWQRKVAPSDFEIRAVLTRKGVTNVGLFSKEIARAEWLADQPRRDRLAAKRLAKRSRPRQRPLPRISTR
jgi:hypothetical protein